MIQTRAAHCLYPVKLQRWVKPLMSHLHRPTLRIVRPVCAALICLGFQPQTQAATHGGACETHARLARLSLAVGELESWEPVDARTLLVWAPAARRAHLLHLDRRVLALMHAPTLTLVDGDRDGVITACGHDGIQVSAGRNGKAFIRSIEYLSEKRTVELDRRGWPVIPLQAGRAPVRHDERPG